MNRCKIAHMKINEKEVQLRFGMLAVEVFLTKTSQSDLELSFYSAFGVSAIIYAGMVNFYSVKGLPLPVSFEEIYDHVENGMLNGGEMEEIKQAIGEFESSQALKKKTESLTAAVEDVKKNLTSMSSEPLPLPQD